MAFEANGYEHDGSSGWSVMVQGQADLLTDQGRLAGVEAKVAVVGPGGWANRLMAIAGPEPPPFVCTPAPFGYRASAHRCGQRDTTGTHSKGVRNVMVGTGRMRPFTLVGKANRLGQLSESSRRQGLARRRDP